MTNLSLDDACDDDCPVAKANTVFGHKWTSLIVRELIGGTKSYSQIERALPGISPRMLAMRLNMLCELKLVRKKIYPTVPPQTDYTLTQKGRGMVPVIEAMAAFGSKL